MGPEGAKSFPGRRLVPIETTPGARARQEIDYGRRGRGYVFGAFQPASGEAFTAPYAGRTTANWVDFLERADTWLPSEAEPVYAIVDNLSTHSAPDVLLFSLALTVVCGVAAGLVPALRSTRVAPTEASGCTFTHALPSSNPSTSSMS